MIKIATFSLSIYYGPTAHRTIISSTGLTIVHLLSNLIFTATHESGTVINLILQRGSWSSETIWKLSGVSQLAAELNFKPRVAAPVFYQSSIKLPPLTVHRLSASSIQNSTPIYKLTERAAVAATNLWIRSTGSNCNLRTSPWRYWRAVLWNPNQMWFTLKDGNSSSSWRGKMKFAEQSSLCFETSYTCLGKSEIPI